MPKKTGNPFARGNPFDKQNDANSIPELLQHLPNESPPVANSNIRQVNINNNEQTHLLPKNIQRSNASTVPPNVEKNQKNPQSKKTNVNTPNAVKKKFQNAVESHNNASPNNTSSVQPNVEKNQKNPKKNSQVAKSPNSPTVQKQKNGNKNNAKKAQVKKNNVKKTNIQSTKTKCRKFYV